MKTARARAAERKNTSGAPLLRMAKASEQMEKALKVSECVPEIGTELHGMAGGERRGALHGWTGTENAPTQRGRVPRQMGRASGDRGWQMHHPHTTA